MAKRSRLAALHRTRALSCARSTNGSRASTMSRQARNRSGQRKARGGACLSFVRSWFRSPDGAQRNPGRPCRRSVAPGFRFAPSGLRRKMKEAERRQTQGTTAASCDAARALAERARLTAFHRGSHLREYFIPKAQLQARFPRTRSERALPAFACPSPGMHLPPRSSCRGTDTQAAREQAANPPAGTAPAPMTRCASAPCPSPERGLYGNRNRDVCQ